MSRPPSGKTSFATFFPAAPSVLKQRKSSKESSTAKSSREESDHHFSHAVRQKVATHIVGGEDPAILMKHNANAKSENAISSRYADNESVNGDLLNTVGSASSTSTASSVFSTAQGGNAVLLTNGLLASAHTPMTSSDSPPPTKVASPRFQTSGFIKAPSRSGNSTPRATNSMPKTLPTNARKRARETGYVVKGQKITYDPDLDKNLDSRERKKGKPIYEDFGTCAEDEIPPTDPRLSVAQYHKGGPKKSKSYLRSAPIVLKAWLYDAELSLGVGPPTRIVVSGFNPMTAPSQISAVFSVYGDIAELDNKTDPGSGRLIGVCGIRYKDATSFKGGDAVSAMSAARTAHIEGKKGLRIGLNDVRVELDGQGVKLKQLSERMIDKFRKETTVMAATKSETPSKVTGPPPTAPKGPSARPTFRAPPPPPLSTTSNTLNNVTPRSATRSAVKPATPGGGSTSLVEQTPILSTIKREPYIFIAHCYVPVLSTTIAHLQKRLKMYDWTAVRCDETGYFITFENSKRGEHECKRVYDTCNMNPLFTYVMNMEIQQFGNPAFDRSPSPVAHKATLPVPPVIENLRREDRTRVKRERDADVEEEKRQRAKDMDPSRAVMQLLAVELREKLLDDVKTKIAAHALYEYLEPDRHADKRRRLGIDDPRGPRRTLFDRSGDSPSVGTPDSRVELSFSGRKPLLNKSMNILALPRINKKAGFERGAATFRDERRKPQRPAIRPLFHQLSQFQEEEDSDDEQRTSITRDTEDLESRPASRMSLTSVSSDDEALVKKAAKRRFQKREDSEALDIVRQESSKKETADDLIITKLERNLSELSPTSRKRKRLVKELEARKRQKADDELFGIGGVDFDREDSVDVKVSEADTPSVLEATPDVDSDAPKAMVKKIRPKKKTKKQIEAERRALAQAQAEAEAAEIVDNVMEAAEAEEIQAELEERQPIVEWGVSTTEPLCTVQDDEDEIPDLDAWEKGLYDEEDLRCLQAVLDTKNAPAFPNIDAWAWRQRQGKLLNPLNNDKSARTECGIQGYYIPNASGSARTEPIRRILESEKSKYLPHRIKVQKARERREAEALKDPKGTAKIETTKSLPKASSRGRRVEDRRAVKEIEVQKDLLSAMSGDTDVLRFNQLLKRKKPVRFARSAIHNWGLYTMENITAGEMIIEYVGEKIRQEIADLRERKYTESGIGSSYLFRIDEGTVIDATKKGGIARFVNHSCMPNCTAKIIRVNNQKRIVIYALRDIDKGEKILMSSFDRILTMS